jgi:hypothetical protein
MTRTWAIVWTEADLPPAAAIVDAETFLDALDRCDELGIRPGGAARGKQIIDWVAPEYRDRLLTPDELGRAAIEPPAGGEESKS